MNKTNENPNAVAEEAAQPADNQPTPEAQLEAILAPLREGKVSDETVTLLRQALQRDEDLKNADMQGYLRGKNEKIDLVTHAAATTEEETVPEPAPFPHYTRRSVWER